MSDTMEQKNTSDDGSDGDFDQLDRFDAADYELDGDEPNTQQPQGDLEPAPSGHERKSADVGPLDDPSQGPAKTDRQQGDQADESSFDEGLLNRAEEYDIDREEAEKFESPDVLERHLDLLDRQLVAWGRQQPQQGQPRQPQTPNLQQPQAGPKDGQAQAPEALKLEWDPDAVDPKISENVDRLNSHVSSQMQQVQQAVGAVVQYLQQQQEGHLEDQFDGMIDGLQNEVIKKELGAGRATKSLSLKSPIYVKREEVAEAIKALERGYLRRQQVDQSVRVPPFRSLFDRAVRMVFSDRIEQQAQQTIQGSLSRRRKRFVNPPSQRKSSGRQTPESRAGEANKQFWQGRGLDSVSLNEGDEF